MDKKNKHIDRLTPDILLAYRAGKLTAEQMHEVERLMLEDSLANDAIEGFSNITPEEMESDLAELSSRVDQVVHDERKGFWTVWTRAAAVFLLLATSVGLFYIASDSKLPTEDLSKLEKPATNAITDSLKEAEPDTVNADNPSIKFSDTSALAKSSDDLSEERKEKADAANIESDLETEFTEVLTQESLTTEAAPAPIEPQEISIPMKEFEIQLDSILNVRFEAGVESEESEPALESRSLSNESSQRSFAAPQRQASAVNQIRGIVRGADDGLPLPQVNVMEKGTTNGVPTNIEGEFTIFVKPKATLVVRYLGYITQEVKTDGKLPLTIELIPDATSLGEVVVTGVASATDAKKLPFSVSKIRGGQIDGSRQGESRKQKSLEIVARPEGGFRAFNQYLKDNIRYPQSARETNVKGRVTLEFQVSSTGELSGFNIIKGLGYGCDEEAIRLIQEGPKWTPRTVGPDKTPINSTVKIKVRFRP